MDELSKERWEVFISLLMGYSECRDFIHSLLSKHKFREDEFLSSVFNLLKFITDRNIAISLLIQENYLWDAQIIMRTVLEASFKLFYLCNCTEAEKKERLREYLYDLAEINSLKQSEVAKKMIGAFKENKDIVIQYKPMLLDKNTEERLKEKWTRKKRQVLEQKWSFSEILAEQATRFQGFEKELLTLSHPYRISSHLIHADETGIGIVAERSLRTEIDKEKIELHHFCSLMKYSIDNFFLCGQVLCSLLNEDHQILKERYVKLYTVFAQIEVYSKDVFKDPSYDKFR